LDTQNPVFRFPSSKKRRRYLQTEFFDFVWQMTLEDVMRNMKDMPLPVKDDRIRQRKSVIDVPQEWR
jgi:hypothetical protein